MIPVARIGEVQLGGEMGVAMQLEPDGLQFYKPVTCISRTAKLRLFSMES